MMTSDDQSLEQVLCFENEHVRVTLVEGVLVAKYRPKANIGIDAAKQIVKDRLDYSKGSSYPMLGDVSDGIKLDNKARDYFNTPESILGISAGAFLISNRIERFIGNTWLKLAKPPIPFRLFTDKAAAMKWLQTFKYMN